MVCALHFFIYRIAHLLIRFAFDFEIDNLVRPLSSHPGIKAHLLNNVPFICFQSGSSEYQYKPI